MSTKRDRALSEYKGHRGSATVAHVERNIEQAYPTAWEDLTGVQYGCVMSVANLSYHDGKTSAGAWVDSGLVGVGDCVVPVALIKAIRKVEHVEHEYKPVTLGGGQDPLSHMSGPRSFYNTTHDEITSRDVPGTEYWADWQRAQLYLQLHPGETLYTRTDYYVTDYYISDNLIYSERC